jgi:hypothetical protein
MLLAELTQHSMTPPLHHSMSSSDHPIRPCQHIQRYRQTDLLRGFRLTVSSISLRLLTGKSTRLFVLAAVSEKCRQPTRGANRLTKADPAINLQA